LPLRTDEAFLGVKRAESDTITVMAAVFLAKAAIYMIPRKKGEKEASSTVGQ